MDLRLFSYTLLCAGTIFYFIPVENIKSKNIDKEDIPLVVFEKPGMYTLTTEKITRKVDASKVTKYLNKDEMLDANIILNGEDLQFLKANEVISKNNKITLTGDVVYQKGDFLKLTTAELFYKEKEKLVYNTTEYKATYFKSEVEGKNLYFDTNKNNLKSRNVHFELELDKKGQ